MSAQRGRKDDWLTGLKAGCDRLVHPAVAGAERARQARLLGVLLVAPFIAAAAIAQGAWPVWGVAGVLAMLCAVFGTSWLIALSVVVRGRAEEAQWAALGAGAVLAGALVALSGGPGTPAAVLLAVVPLETWWVARSRKVAGAALATSGIAVGVFMQVPGLGDAAAASAWQWIAPALYGATLALRRTVAEGEGAKADRREAVLAETAFDAVVVRLSRAGEAESVSPQASRILGIDPALLLGSGLFERVHVGDRVAFLCAAAQVRDGGGPARCDARIRMPAAGTGEAGHFRPFEVDMVAAGDGAVAAIIRDGGEKAALRRELVAAREEADASEVAKGRFLATVSHELRTPLNAIIGFSDMLLHREISGDLAPKQAEQVGLIRDAGNHLLSVVNAILDVSKIESGSYRITVEPFDLKPAVELCCAMLEPQAAERGVTLTARLPHGLGQVLGDRRAVQQILINLLSNAVKFTPEGGHVTVNAASRDGTVRIFVNDTGIGIGNDDLAKLGRPFMQVQNDYTRQFQGTGLGLSLVKGLVKLHGGSMSIESAPGLGTTVTVGLPAATPAECGVERDTAGETAGGETGERHGIALRKIA